MPILLLLILLLTGGFQPSWPASPVNDMVRWDWYFRESLTAIRDWEAVLAAWEETTPEEECIPVFPVPANGETVEWPNPIPRLLRPEEDRERRVRVRLVGDKVEVERLGPEGKGDPETAALGETVLGYKHPGGGGHDRWYHGYQRRFDTFATFRPRPAPFALGLEPPCDLKLGGNELAVRLRNVTAHPLSLTVRLDFRSPQQQRTCGERTVALAEGATEELNFPVELWAQGGGVLLLTVQALTPQPPLPIVGEGETSIETDASLPSPKIGGEGLLKPYDSPFWIPLFTHVEDVAAVFKSIEQILADTPDAPASARLGDLRQRAGSALGADWRALFEAASALRDELLLQRLSFDTLLFVKRQPFDSEQPFMDAHHLRNRPGGGIYRLSPVRPDGEVTPVVDSLGEGIYRDLCLHWEGTKFLFSFGNGNDSWDGQQSYHLYEGRVDGAGLRQLTFGPKNDCEPFYLPNGQIGFTSDRSEHFVMCGGDRHAPTLFVMEGDGSAVRQLSFNCFNDFNPTVLPDGRILYSRWEYNERSVTSLHNPFTIFPDGTMMAPFYGNATIRPNVVMFPRPVPGSHQVLALFTAHHGQTHGPIGLIDTLRGMDGSEPLTVLTPNVPLTGEKAEESFFGWFSDPQPLSETTYLCSFTPTAVPWLERSWALYVGDRHGNLALVYRDPGLSCAEPIPLVSRPCPHVLPPAPPDTDDADAEATLLLLNVYEGLPGVPRGEAKYLRIVEDVPRKSVHWGGVVCTAATSIYTIKRIFGTVPLESDGSAYFVVPANRNVYFEVLDGDYLEIQRMRSVVCLKPRETRTCVGCHEPRTTAPPNRRASALRRRPSRPAPPPWGTETLSFLRDVQPLLNAKCVRCHTHDRTANRVILTDDLTDQFCIGYEELLPYLRVANAMRWDHPDDVYPQPPYTYGSKVSPLTELLRAGHHGVELTGEDWQRLVNWIDANGVYYDRYETNHYDNRHLFTGDLRKALEEVYTRRCAPCHGGGDGGYATWWLSLNRREVRLSRALQAPLARSSGGWGRCDETVFATTEDPDFQTLLAAFTTLRDGLGEHPREDLLSLRGTAAEQQAVVLPPPPLPHPPAAEERPEGDWVYLSDLAWESGRAGWTPNNDGLPRLDRDVEDHPLRLGLRRYPKGLGTHAPSEIVYRLDGQYLRFFALVGGAEAGGTVVFQVFGDDQLLCDSGVMHGLREVKEIDVSVAGRQQLRLVVTDGGDGYISDMANWAGARLRRAPTEAVD